MRHSWKVWAVFIVPASFALWCAYDGWLNADISEQDQFFNQVFAVLAASYAGLLAYVAVRLRSDPPRTGIAAVVRFQRPEDGRIEESPVPWLWSAMPFGFVYFALKRAWLHAVIWVVVSPLGLGIFYVLFARRLVEKSYLRHGWRPI